MAKKSLKKKLQYWGTGRRKKAIARVRLIPDRSEEHTSELQSQR